MNVHSVQPGQSAQPGQVAHTPYPQRPHADDPGIVTQNDQQGQTNTAQSASSANTVLFQNAHTPTGTRVDSSR
jgi:hypothetical protein